MSRPNSKQALITEAESGFTLLNELIESFNNQEKTGLFPFEDRDRSIKDVLVHLYEWQQMMHVWYVQGQKGLTPEIPKAGYNWRQLPTLNYHIRDMYEDVLYDQALILLKTSHRMMIEFSDKMDEDELLTASYYKWQGKWRIIDYLHANTTAHYAWAFKKIKRYKKALRDAKV